VGRHQRPGGGRAEGRWLRPAAEAGPPVTSRHAAVRLRPVADRPLPARAAEAAGLPRPAAARRVRPKPAGDRGGAARPAAVNVGRRTGRSAVAARSRRPTGRGKVCHRRMGEPPLIVAVGGTGSYILRVGRSPPRVPTMRRACWIAVLLWVTPAFAADWKPQAAPLMTRWAKDVDPARPLPEYPRPTLVRPDWQNLNGLWDYAIRPKAEGKPDKFDGHILVPFPVESALSGVMKMVGPDNRLWYRRTFTVPAGWAGKRTLLHFGACDWETTVWV